MYNFSYDGSKMKLHIENEKYFVNEEKRTITVVADVHVELPEFITKTIYDNQLPNGFIGHYASLWGDNNITFKHTAKCAPGDQWDEEKGKKIAMAALEAKAYRSMKRRLWKWFKKFNEYANMVSDLCFNFAVRAKNAAEHDDRYIHEIA